MNEPISVQIGTNLPPGQLHERSTSVKGQGHRKPGPDQRLYRP